MPRLAERNLNMPPPAVPVLRSKARALGTVDNKVTNISLPAGKGALLDRQRENAAKLMSGRSVVNKENQVAKKQNDMAKKTLHSDIIPKKSSVNLPKPLKQKEDKQTILKKTESTNSLHSLKDDSISQSKPFLLLKVSETEQLLDLEKKIESIPLGVIDTDKQYMNNEFLLGVYAKDIYNFLRYLENSQNIRKKYLTADHIMTQRMRSLLVDWFFEVQISFKLLNETIQLAIALLDRFMQDHPKIVKDELQLVGVTCIFLASKYEEMYPPDLEDFVDIAAQSYSKEQILRMELVIFASLGFQMGRPSPSQFLRRYARVGKVDLITYNFSKYFVDLSLVCYEMCHIAPSLIAAASMYLSMFLTSENTDIWTPTLEYYSQYKLTDLQPVVYKLAEVVWAAPKSKYQTVQKKYLDAKKLSSVSARGELQSDKLLKIINNKEQSNC